MKRRWARCWVNWWASSTRRWRCTSSACTESTKAAPEDWQPSCNGLRCVSSTKEEDMADQKLVHRPLMPDEVARRELELDREGPIVIPRIGAYVVGTRQPEPRMRV